MSAPEHRFLIVKIQKNEYRRALVMVRESFNALCAKDFTESGGASFLRYASLHNFSARQKKGHVTFIAKEGARLAGMVELRETGHITMLFVSPETIGRGCGSALLTHAIDRCKQANGKKQSSITLNASPYAHGFYLKKGFFDDGETVDDDGLIYTPMRMYIS